MQVHQDDARPRPFSTLLGIGQRGRRTDRARVRPALDRQLHHRMAQLYLHAMGQHAPPYRFRHGTVRFRRTDGGQGARPGRGTQQPRTDRRGVCRSVARALVPALGALHRHAARLWLRRQHGRVDHRLSCGLGGRMGHGAPFELQLPQPRADRRHDHPDRQGGQQVRRRARARAGADRKLHSQAERRRAGNGEGRGRTSAQAGLARGSRLQRCWQMPRRRPGSPISAIRTGSSPPTTPPRSAVTSG